MIHLTPRERIALEYLSPLAHADTWRIGVKVYCGCRQVAASANPERVGAGVCARLRKRGLVAFLPGVRIWRITSAGRDAVGSVR